MENAADIYHSKMMETLLGSMTQLPIFRSLTEDELKEVARYMFFLEFAENMTVFREGDSGDYVCFVVEGLLEVTKKAKSGGITVIAQLVQGHSIGEMSVIDEFQRSATVTAREKSRLVTLTRKNFETLVDQHPRIGNKMLKGIARSLSMNLRKTSGQLAEKLPVV